MTDYTREHQQKVDEAKFVENTKKELEKNVSETPLDKPSEKTKSTPSKKQLKKLSKSKVGSSK